MSFFGFGGFKTKVIKPNLKMAVHRIRLTTSKATQAIAKERREVGALLAEHKFDKARIRVESVIRKEREMEAHEVIELMCELLHERIQLIQAEKECPPDLLESVSTLIWASRRVTIAELGEVRKQLVAKYGDEFAANAMANRDPCRVNTKVYHRLSISAPDVSLITEYLVEIAAANGVEFSGTEHLKESLLDRPPVEPAGSVPTMPPMMPGSGPGGYPEPPHPSSGAPTFGPGGYPMDPAAPSPAQAPAPTGGYPGAPGGPAPAAPGYPAPGTIPPMMPPAAGYGGGAGGAPPPGYGAPPPGYGAPPAGYGGGGGGGVPPAYPSGAPPPGYPSADAPPPPYSASGGTAPAPPAYPSGSPTMPSFPSAPSAPSAPEAGASPGSGGGVGGAAAGGGAPAADVPSFDDLSARFAALKKK